MSKKALLLCAGLGTRLRPLTDSVPKCLVPIRGKPLLQYWFENLIDQSGFDEILLNTHYLPEQVERFVGSSSYRDRVKLVYEPQLLGTGGTLKANQDFFKDCSDFLVAHGDNYTSFSAQDFFKAHQVRPQGCLMTMLLFDTDTPESCGIVQKDSMGRVEKFFEKVKNPPSTLANGAVYMMNREMFPLLTAIPDDFVDLSTQIIPQLMGKIFTYDKVNFHLDIGTMSSWEKAQSLVF